jgi:hypothetical protein
MEKMLALALLLVAGTAVLARAACTPGLVVTVDTDSLADRASGAAQLLPNASWWSSSTSAANRFYGANYFFVPAARASEPGTAAVFAPALPESGAFACTFFGCFFFFVF